MPPELLSEGQMSKAADVYAMGVLLWEVCWLHRFSELSRYAKSLYTRWAAISTMERVLTASSHTMIAWNNVHMSGCVVFAQRSGSTTRYLSGQMQTTMEFCTQLSPAHL